MHLPGRLSSKPSSISILIVDDEADIRVLTRSVLEEHGFRTIYEAASGEEALQLAHKHKPDLIVLDYMMPSMNGETVAKGLRLLAPRTLILVFSGVLRMHPAWADGFVDKLSIGNLPAQIVGLVDLRNKVIRLGTERKKKKGVSLESRA